MENTINIVVFGDNGAVNSLTENLKSFDELRIVGHAMNINEAKNIVSGLAGCVVVYAVSDQEYDRIDEFLKYINERNIKSLLICRNATEGFLMLQKGATEMVVKTDLEIKTNSRFAYSSVLMKIKHIYDLNNGDTERKLKNEYNGSLTKIVGIGSSTGGTETVQRILVSMPADAPPVLVVQHMPPVFTKLFAERLHNVCKMSVWEAKDGDELKRGLVLIAPGDYHMSVSKRDSKYYVNCRKGEKVNGHCPSVDVMFDSMSKLNGNLCLGVILTGMGADGAMGLLNMRNNGSYTIGQDEESSVVYGMPKAAFVLGAVTKQFKDTDIARAIMDNV